MDNITINSARITKQGIETKTTKDGRPMARFKVMWSSSRPGANQQWENGPTKFLRVTCFDNLARWVANGLAAESVVKLSGRIEHFEWQSDKGPQDDWNMIADFVAPFTPRQRSQDQGFNQQQSRQGYQQQGFAPQPGDDEPPF